MTKAVVSRSLQKYTDDFFGKYLLDDSVNEICYNGGDMIFYQDFQGKWQSEKSNKLNYETASSFAQASASYKQDQIQKSRPVMSSILNSGERVQIVIPPATKQNHVSITIRKPSKKRYKFSDYEEQGIFEEIIAEDRKVLSSSDKEILELYKSGNYVDFLAQAVKNGKNIVIAGETGSGKTTFMKSLIDFIPLNERIITIEDTEEIKFYEHKNFVQLFYPSEAKSDDFLNSATLLKSCLRMKPDRILLAELRGPETYDFINVVSSGHNGSITSCHAGSIDETFTRLTLMTLQNPQGQKMPYDTIQKTLKGVIDIVIHLYAHNGKRRISEIYYKGAENETK